MLSEEETVKRRSVAKTPPRASLPDMSTPPSMSQVPTRKLPRAPFADEDTLVLASISGITPLPVATQANLIIDAGWYRRFDAWLHKVSGAKADGIMQLVSFLVIGGSASLLNLIIIFAFDLLDKTHHNDLTRHLIYSAIATEISLLYNFMLNDRFTFHAMIDQRRTWLQRCIRFHGPASVGFVLTLILSSVFFSLTQTLPHHAVIAQAMAIVIVTAVNFTMHRFWTYRPSKATAQAQAHS